MPTGHPSIWLEEAGREIAWAVIQRGKSEAMGTWILSGGLAQRVDAGGHNTFLASALGGAGRLTQKGSF